MTEQLYTPSLQQRQQQQPVLSSRHLHLSRPSTSSGSASPSLRRTPNLEEDSPWRQRIQQVQDKNRSASVDSSRAPLGPRPAVHFTDDTNTHYLDQGASPRHRNRASSESRATDRSVTPVFGQDKRAPHPVLRISRRTASAILYALEEAIRAPNPFSPDLEEENASMSEVLGGSGGRAAANGGRAASGPVPVPPQPQQTTPPTSNTAPATGMRTPREVMQQRHAREEKRRAEAEEIARRQREDERRRSAERRAAAAGVAGQSRDSGGSNAGGRQGVTQTQVSGAGYSTYGGSSSHPQQQQQPQASQTQDLSVGAHTRQRGPSLSQDQPRPVSQQASQAQSAPARPFIPQQPAQPRQPATAQQQTSRTGTAGQPNNARDQHATQQPAAQTTSNFPHAFERWETLSSHWEGLTSYWLHRLEANESELRAQPLAAQMSRQIADLSAAGANLFHAVVELQRLRASSERKFQRWFFDTRAEQERAREVQADLERTLRAEREARKQLERGTEERQERDSRNAQRIVQETRRELQIAKDEARRAWEELGRREQEERERTMSLREGLPTVVGGIHVIPMMAGGGVGSVGVSRAGSTSQSQRPDGHEGGYSEQHDPFIEGPQRQQQHQYNQGPPGGPPGEGQQRNRGPYPPTSAPATKGNRTTAPAATGPSQQHPNPGTSSAAQAPHERERPGEQAYSQPSPSAAALAAAQSSGGPTFYTHPEAHLPGTTAPMPPHSNGHIPPPAPTVSAVGTSSGRYQRRSAADEEEIISSEEDDDAQQRRYHNYDENDPYDRRVAARRRAATGASTESDEYDVREELERERALAARYGVGPSSTSASAAARYQTSGGDGGYEYDDYDPRLPGGAGGGTGPPDYSGAGFGPGWDAMRTHHHPTRLSDVIEEDERSRTSPSRTSQASRGLF